MDDNRNNRDDDGNNWDLSAVVRLGCGRRPVPSRADDLFASILPPPLPQLDAAHWEELFPDLPAPSHLIKPVFPAPQLPSPPQPQPQGLYLPQQGEPTAIDNRCQALLIAAPKPPEHQAPPLQSPAPRDEAPPPSVVHAQAAADEPPVGPEKEKLSGDRDRAEPSRPKAKSSKKKRAAATTRRVLADAPATEMWAWRKYGQKPIRGSPYLRSYYRCSTDKACKARKRVERCQDDPRYLIVSFTGKHSHPMPTTVRTSTLPGTYSRRIKPVLPTLLPQFLRKPAQEKPPPPQDLLAPAPPETASLSSRTTPPAELEVEEEDAVTLGALLEDVGMNLEDALLMGKPDAVAEPVVMGNGWGEGGLLFPLSDEQLAPGSGGGSTWIDVGGGSAATTLTTTAPTMTPIINVGGGSATAPIMMATPAPIMNNVVRPKSSVNSWKPAAAAAGR